MHYPLRMNRPAVEDCVAPTDEAVIKFARAIREIFRGEPWEIVEPYAGRAFALLELARCERTWVLTREFLRTTWVRQ